MRKFDERKRCLSSGRSFRRTLADIFAPERIRSELLDEGGVGRALRIRQARDQGPLTDFAAPARCARQAPPPRGLRGEIEADLPAADQLDIDLGQDFRVEQRAVLRALGIVDAIAGAERIEIVRRTRMLAPGQREGVDRIRKTDRRMAGAGEFRIDEADIEGRVVDDEAPSPMKS